MNCPNCGTDHQVGAKFCKKCGKELPPAAPQAADFCPQCGKPIGAQARFCKHCGKVLVAELPPAAAIAPIPAPIPTPLRRHRTPGWIIAAALLLVVLTCGFLFWSLLIPIPLLASTSPAAEFLAQLRFFQQNLDRPPFIENLAQDAREREIAQALLEQDLGIIKWDENGDELLPAACGPQVDLTVAGTGEVHISDMWGRFAGRGPLVYFFQNNGESMLGAKFGYHAVWTVVDEGKHEVIANDHWYSCAGWDQNQLTCAGPNWQNYDSAQMCIFSDNPDCPLPVKCFTFQGQDLLPVDEQQACDFDVDFVLEKFSDLPGYPDLSEYYFRTTDLDQYDGKYILTTGGIGALSSDTSEFVYFGNSRRGTEPGQMIFNGRNPNNYEQVWWSIEVTYCPEYKVSGVIDGGEIGGTGSGEVSVEVDCEADFDFTVEQTVGLPQDIQTAHWRIRTTDVNMYNYKYVLMTHGTGNPIENNATSGAGSTCSIFPGTPGLMECWALDPETWGSVTWELRRRPKEICTDILASGKYVNGVAQGTQPQDPCSYEAGTVTNAGQRTDEDGGSYWLFNVAHPEKLVPGLQKYSLYTRVTGDYADTWCSVDQRKAPHITCWGKDPSVHGQVTWQLYREQKEPSICKSEIASGTVRGPGSSAGANDRCSLFDGMDMSLVFLSWTRGTPLPFYIKMAGGVPGLGRNIAGDNARWDYHAHLSGFGTDECFVDSNYPDRLYCTMVIGADGSTLTGGMHLTLFVNDCQSFIHEWSGVSLPTWEVTGPPPVEPPASGPTPYPCGSACSSPQNNQCCCNAAGGSWLHSGSTYWCDFTPEPEPSD